MTYQHDNYNWLLRFERGEPVIAGLVNFARQQAISGGWLSGLGGAEAAELGFYQLNQQKYQWQMVNELLEVLSLQGNLAWQDGQPVWHVHGSFAKADLTTVGGHVRELIAGGTVEVFIHKWYGDQLQRQLDKTVGLNTLNL